MTGIDQFDDSPFSPMSPQSHNEEPVSSVREPTVTGEDNQCEGEDFGGEPLERDGLTDRQRKALKTVYQCGARRTAFLLVTETYSLLKRCERLGLDFMIMKRTMEYMAQEAPIIIHFKVEDQMLTKLLNDTHYRNLFETGVSNGNKNKYLRSLWEDKVFWGCYHDAEDYERPKYGVLNLSKDPRGLWNIRRAYGLSYMVVKNRLRARCTVAEQDTSHPVAIVTDFRWERMILLFRFFTDKELIDVTKVATGKKPHGDSTLAIFYKEVQIHGPVRLNEDVEELVLHPWYREKCYIETLEMLKKKHGINYSWMKLENEHKIKVAHEEEDKE